MTIEMMCPVCLCRDWNKVDNGIFSCERCGNTIPVGDMISGSDYYVYRFVNDDWGGIPFYVGKGSKDRMHSMSGRSKHILRVCEKYRWHTEVVRYCESEKESWKYEAALKKEYKEAGYPIIDYENISEAAKINQRAGIDAAKAAGKYKGGTAKTIPVGFYDLYEEYIHRAISKSRMAVKLGVSRPTLDKWMKAYENNGGQKECQEAP